MIGKNKGMENGMGQERINTVIGAGSVINGSIVVPEAIRVDGTIQGDCSSKGNMVLGAEGKVEGNISAQNVVISGTVTGDITATGKLEILSTGKVTGSVKARGIVIDEDAFFDGNCTMINNTQVRSEGKTEK